MGVEITYPYTLPSLSDPATFNARALQLFAWLTGQGDNQLLGELADMDASDFFEVQSSTVDPTEGRVLLVGGFGLGRGVRLNSVNLNVVVNPGLYYANDPSTNKPTAQGGTLIVAADGGGSALVQIFSERGFGATYIRIRDSSGTFQAWRTIFDSRNLLGTVSQSSGVPTGAVIERGSNANGEYVRLADGTQICTHILTLNTVATSNLSAVWTYPAAFSSLHVVSAAPDMNTVNSTAPGLTGVGQCAPSNETTTGTTVALYRITGLTDFTSGNSAAARCLAIGRWF